MYDPIQLGPSRSTRGESNCAPVNKNKSFVEKRSVGIDCKLTHVSLYLYFLCGLSRYVRAYFYCISSIDFLIVWLENFVQGDTWVASRWVGGKPSNF